VQIDPIKSALKPPGTKRLNLEYDEPPSNFAFKFNLRRYILDHDMTRFTNIEAQVYYPEDDGVVQVEHFGIHCRMDGTIVYGLMIESVMVGRCRLTL
jgi:hypothetical protein